MQITFTNAGTLKKEMTKHYTTQINKTTAAANWREKTELRMNE